MLKLKGKGAPRLGASGKGDLLARIKVLIPEKLSGEQKDLLKKFAEVAAGRPAGRPHRLVGLAWRLERWSIMAARSRTEEKKMPFEDKMRPVFMISVAAELAEMHPQTLRMYERRGLIRPRRSSKSTRLYSLADVERLRRIQQLVAECGLNLAGVERVLEMEEQLETLQRRLDQLQAEMDRLAARGQGRAGGRPPQLPQGTGPARRARARSSSSPTSAAVDGERRDLPTPAPDVQSARRHGAALRQPSQPPDDGHVQRLRQTTLPRLHGVSRRWASSARNAPRMPRSALVMLKTEQVPSGHRRRLGDGHRAGLRLLLHPGQHPVLLRVHLRVGRDRLSGRRGGQPGLGPLSRAEDGRHRRRRHRSGPSCSLPSRPPSSATASTGTRRSSPSPRAGSSTGS